MMGLFPSIKGDNKLTASIPAEFVNLKNLSFLDLGKFLYMNLKIKDRCLVGPLLIQIFLFNSR